jgi:hypothetical protein
MAAGAAIAAIATSRCVSGAFMLIESNATGVQASMRVPVLRAVSSSYAGSVEHPCNSTLLNRRRAMPNVGARMVALHLVVMIAVSCAAVQPPLLRSPSDPVNADSTYQVRRFLAVTGGTGTLPNRWLQVGDTTVVTAHGSRCRFDSCTREILTGGWSVSDTTIIAIVPDSGAPRAGSGPMLRLVARRIVPQA